METTRKHRQYRRYLIIFIGIPLFIWTFNNQPARSLLKETISILTILSFCQMLGMFFWSRINRFVLNGVRAVQMIRIHKIIGYICTSVLLLHPFLLLTPRFFEAGVSPFDAFFTIITTFNIGVVLGMLSWILLVIIGVMSLTRKRLPIKYKTWRNLHGALALAFVFIATWHVINLGRHSGATMSIFIIILTGGSMLLLGKHYILKILKRQE